MQKNISENELLKIKREKLEKLVSEGKDPHVHTKYDVTDFSTDIKNDFDKYSEKEVSLAGRLMSRRGHGKISFMDLQDSHGRIQVIAKFDAIGEEKWPYVKDLDIGDIVGVRGKVLKTKVGEISVQANEITLLTKSLQVFPEKFHGLTDTDLRYRMRYLDLIVNPEIKDVFVKRTKILSSIRKYLDDRGFLEVETPILNNIPGGGEARPFKTHHNTLHLDMFMRIANELYLKRLIVGGFDKVYEMGRMFRNEGMDSTHNPEFTSIELYEAYTNLESMMKLTEELIEYIALQVHGTTKVVWQDTEIDFKAPWKRISMLDAVNSKLDIDFMSLTDEEAKNLAKEHHLENALTLSKGKIMSELFEKYCEEDLTQPTFIYDHPVDISPLAKKKYENPFLAERFEAYVCSSEIANAYSELNDALDQRRRFEQQMELRKNGDDEAHIMDEDFVKALEYGMPPTGGLGIGIDRLIMFMTNSSSIRDVLLFPTMKPLNDAAKNNDNE